MCPGRSKFANQAPLLLIRSSIEKAGAKLDFENEKVIKVIMSGTTQDLLFTSIEHYCIPLNRRRNIIEEISCNKSTTKSFIH